jgi:hypothetical protein
VSLAPAKKGFKNHSAMRQSGSAAQRRVSEAILEARAENSHRNSGSKVHSAHDNS